MRAEGKLDYLELQVGSVALERARTFYAQAFGWTFTGYGPTYAAYSEGLDGGLDASAGGAAPLPVLFSAELEDAQERVEAAGGRVVRPIFPFPGGRRFHFLDPAGNELAVWGE